AAWTASSVQTSRSSFSTELVNQPGRRDVCQGMHRSWYVLPVVGVLVGLLLAAPPAGAATRSVNIVGFGFSARSATAVQGDTVTWSPLDTGTQHASTSNQGFWHSPLLSAGESYSQTTAFKSAGSYGYHCAVHPDMTGVVHVPLKASGSPTTGWTVRWSSLSSTPSSRAFDVQIKRPGTTTWAAFRTDSARRSVF